MPTQLKADRIVQWSTAQRVAGIVCLLGALAGCGSDQVREEGRRVCTPPPHEDSLLTTYRRDPVFAVAPEGTRRQGSPTSHEGCREYNGTDLSTTTVELSMELAQAYPQARLAAAYDKDIVARGWRPVPMDDASSPELEHAHLYYCKSIAGVPSFLFVGAQWRKTIDASPPGGGSAEPATGTLRVDITAPHGRRCPDA